MDGVYETGYLELDRRGARPNTPGVYTDVSMENNTPGVYTDVSMEKTVKTFISSCTYERLSLV